MQLKELIDKSFMKVYGDENIKVSGLCANSQNVKEGDIFFALEGTKVDGKAFAKQAVEKGAKVVVSRYKIELPKNIVNVVCKDERKAMSLMSASFYNFPAKDLFVIGVTGTNGKTTTTFMLKKIFEGAGKKVGVIGTNGAYIEDQKMDTNMTTPDPILLQQIFCQMREKRVDVVCMEISAHALALQKLWGVMTDIALFTNLTQDHLDFFKTMSKYKRAKEMLFRKEYALCGVVNGDDQFGLKLLSKSEIPLIGYKIISKEGKATPHNILSYLQLEEEEQQLLDLKKSNISIFAYDHKLTSNGQTFKILVNGEKATVNLKLSGLFNVSNALGAIGAGVLYGLKLNDIVQSLGELEMVEGRFNFYDVGGVNVVIDYAHTPDGLLNILKSVRQMARSNKVISVFGCGGNRDKTKRPIMGKISEENSDFTFITKDNPRFEDPMTIAKEVESGMKKSSHEIVLSRESAIFRAIESAVSGDWVVISGKGAEDYIDEMGEKKFYSDKNVVLKIKKDLIGNN